MSANDDVGKLHGKGIAYPPSSPSNPSGPSYLDLNLKKCLETMRTRAVQNRHGARTILESDTIVAARKELIVGCISNPPEAALETEDDDQAGTPDSEGFCETSCLDREVRRLRVLKSYLGVLGADHGNKFERLTALASRIFRTPMAMVTIADLDKQYCISSRGLDFTSTMKSPFCSQAVLADCDLMVVNDATKDCRFAKDPQVTGYPNVRFYAGAPLICPEGHRLGTLCVMDSEPRNNPVSLDDKQSLMELAAMAMDNLVDLRTQKQYAAKDPSQQIACTAHDLLTPLTGIALSLSLLKEDEGLQGKLTDQHRDMIETAANCSTIMNSICHKTMDFFREQARSANSVLPLNSRHPNLASKRAGPPTVKIADLVKNLNMVMEPFPKQVPIIITVEPNVPDEFISDDMKIFRSASNFLTNSCAKTESGSIRLRICLRRNPETEEDELMFECEDTGSGVDVAKYPFLFKPMCCDQDTIRASTTTMNETPSLRGGLEKSGLGLYSVATQIESLGGRYGFRPRDHPCTSGDAGGSKGVGAVFWFSIPLILPGSKDSSIVEAGVGSLLSSSAASRLSSTSLSSGLTKRLSGLLGIEPKCKQVRSDQSLSRLNSEDAVVAYAATPSIESMRNKRFRSPDTPARMSQALVIEDSLVVRKNLARVLTRLGFEVTQAVNGMEGLKELKSSLYDLVLCDFLMPVMDGLDCIQQYRQWEAVNRPFFKQYIIGISAHANDKDVEQAFKIGMNGFRSKPLTYKDIEELKKCDEFNRIRVQLDKLGDEIDFLKRRKLDPKPQRRLSTPPDQKVCLVIEASTVVAKLSELASSTIGWKIVPVMDSDSALRLLKMRNWDAVLVDDDLGCSRCISIFREWEKKHRVNRQKNIVLLSANYVSPEAKGTSFQVPTGFDGALGKPIQLNSLQTFFMEARTSWEIVSR